MNSYFDSLDQLQFGKFKKQSHIVENDDLRELIKNDEMIVNGVVITLDYYLNFSILI